MHLMSTKLERAKLASLETISANIHVIPSSTLRSHSRWSPIRRYGFEPPRLCRRPFGLSYAAMAGASSMA